MRLIALTISATCLIGSAAGQDPPCFYRQEPFFQPSFVTDLEFSGQQLVAGISPDAPHLTARYGQIWVYEEWGDDWQQMQTLDARDLDEALFGRKLAADSIWLVSLASTAVVIHERRGTRWSRSDTIHLPNDRHVRSLTIKDNRLLLGADGAAAYVYLHSDDDWKLEAELTTWDDSVGQFGNHVALGKNTAFVSAPGDDSFGHDTGAVYVFRYDGERWQPDAKLASPDATPEDQFGRPIAATNDLLVVNSFKGGYVASYRVLPDTLLFQGYMVPRSNPIPFIADMDVSGDSVLLGWGEAREYVLKNEAWKPGRSFTLQYPGGCSVAVGQQHLAVDGPCVEAQIVDETDYVCVFDRVNRYLPLDVGDTWTYITVLDPPNAPPDTLWRGRFSVSESVERDGKTYHVTGFPFALADTLRADPQGRIWAYSGGEDILFLDFTLDEGAQYRFPAPSALTDSFEVSIERNVTVEVAAGRFEDCVRVLFDTPALDGDRLYAFAPGVGVVYAYGILGDYAELHSAVVGSRIVSGVEASDHPKVEASMHAYPNPLKETGVLTVDVGTTTTVTVDLFDVLGRRVQTLSDGFVYAGRHAMTIDASSLPAGVYFLRLRAGDRVEIRSLVVAR